MDSKQVIPEKAQPEEFCGEQPGLRWAPGFGIALAVFLMDRISKLLAGKLTKSTVLIPGCLSLTYARNTGMAFSLLAGYPWALGGLSVIVICLAVLYLRKKRPDRMTRTALMMMLGGALGNALDRFVTGFVPDMIELTFVRFPVFNLADTFLCLGCGLMICRLLFHKAPAQMPQDK